MKIEDIDPEAWERVKEMLIGAPIKDAPKEYDATILRREQNKRHPAWEWDDKILEIMERYEDLLVTQGARITQLEETLLTQEKVIKDLLDNNEFYQQAGSIRKDLDFYS